MWLVVESGEHAGRSARVEGALFAIGSAPEADLRIEHEGVAALHASIRSHPDGHLELHDEGAGEGLFVEGERVSDPVALNGDEKLRLGEHVLLRLSLADPEPAPPPEVPAEVVPELAEALGVEQEELVPAGGDPVRRRRRWRTLIAAVRETRRAVRRALVVAAAALAVALTLGILALAGVFGGGQPTSVAEVVEQVGPSTVLVRSRAAGEEATGSGFALDAERGLIVTNFHVINGGRRFDVRVGEGFRQAAVVAAAPCDDLALLRIDETDGLRTLELGDQSQLEQGAEVVALGYPTNPSLRGELTSTSGVVSVPRSEFRLPTPDSPRFENLIQTDAPLNPGNSGGPLVDRDGRLVGVNTVVFAGTREQPIQSQGYAIGVDRVSEVMRELRRGRSQRWFGTGLLPPPPALEREIGRRGLLVTHAVPGTPAADVGLEGVLLLALGGRPVDGTIEGYCRAAEGIESGNRVRADVLLGAGRRPQVITVEFG